MMISKNVVKALSLCLLIAALGACSGSPKRTHVAADSSGTVGALETDKESCLRSCDASFDRCSSTSAAQSPVGRGQMTGVFGAQADCKSAMKSCLANCKNR